MNVRQKLKNIILGALTVLCGLVMLLSPVNGYLYVFLLLTLLLFGNGVYKMIFYFTMARFMVEGRRVLFESIVCLDLGCFAFSQMDAKQSVVIIYMVLGLLFWSGIGIIRAFEQRKFKATQWKRSLVIGVIGLLFTIACLVEARYSANLLAFVYILGIIANGIGRIASAFRRTGIPEVTL